MLCYFCLGLQGRSKPKHPGNKKVSLNTMQEKPTTSKLVNVSAMCIVVILLATLDLFSGMPRNIGNEIMANAKGIVKISNLR